MDTYVTFQIDQDEYALELEYVKEVLRAVAVMKIPQALPFVKGVINLRGQVTPVIDLKQLSFQQPTRYDVDSHLVIARAQSQVLALIVDKVKEVLAIASEHLQRPQDTVPISDFLKAVGQRDHRLLLILDLPKIVEFTRVSYATKPGKNNGVPLEPNEVKAD